VAICQKFASSHERMKPGPQPTLCFWGSGNGSLCWFSCRWTAPTRSGPAFRARPARLRTCDEFQSVIQASPSQCTRFDFQLPEIRRHPTLSSHATHLLVYSSTIQKRQSSPVRPLVDGKIAVGSGVLYSVFTAQFRHRPGVPAFVAGSASPHPAVTAYLSIPSWDYGR
jgi:hypothetical protein